MSIVGAAGDGSNRSFDDGGQVDRCLASHERYAAGAGEDEEIVGELFEPLDLVEHRVERAPQLLIAGGSPAGELQLASDDGDRGPKLVTGVVEKRPFPRCDGPDAVEHGVEPGGQRTELGAATRDLEA